MSLKDWKTSLPLSDNTSHFWSTSMKKSNLLRIFSKPMKSTTKKKSPTLRVFSEPNQVPLKNKSTQGLPFWLRLTHRSMRNENLLRRRSDFTRFSKNTERLSRSVSLKGLSSRHNRNSLYYLLKGHSRLWRTLTPESKCSSHLLHLTSCRKLAIT